MESYDVGRSAETPRRSRSRSRRSLTHGRDRDSSRRSRSYCRRLQDREEALKQEQKRVRQLELELQRERDAEQRRQRSVRSAAERAVGSGACGRQRSVRRGSPQGSTRDHRSRSYSRSRSRSRSRGRSPGHKRGYRSSSRVPDGDYRGDTKSPSSTAVNASTLIISPWYHVMGLMSVVRSFPHGRTTVFLPKFDLDTYLRTIEKYKIAQLILVPPVLVAVCKSTDEYDLSSVKLIYSGAAPLHKDSWESVYKKFPNLTHILQGYGSSECTLGVTQFYFHEIENETENISLTKPASVGKIVSGCVIKIVDTETRQALGPNKQGEICVKGPLIMKGYVGIGRSRDDFDEEGFYKTGDVGYYDDDGYFFIADRLKELIKYKGFQVPPAELEAIILTHPAVKDVGVIGVPHEAAGEVPLAFVVKNSDVTEDELKKYVAERLSNPKHLRGGVRFVTAIPKLLSGKILRKELRKMLKAGKSKL